MFIMETTGRALKAALSVMANINEAENIRISGEGFFGATDELRSATTIINSTGADWVTVNREMLMLKASVCSPDIAVKMRASETTLFIDHGASKWKIPLPVDQSYHDDMVAQVVGVSMTMPAKAFLEGLDAVSPAMSLGGRNPALCGVYVDPGKGDLVATDGVLFFWEAMALSEVKPFIIPAECLGPIHKMFKDCGEITLCRDDRWFSVSGGDSTYRARMVEEVYPDWRRAIPKSVEASASIGRNAIAEAVGQVASINTKKGSGGASGRMMLEISGARAVLTTSNSLGEEGNSEVSATIDNPVSRYVSHKRLALTLASLRAPVIDMEFHTSTGTPIILSDPDNDRVGRMIVCMHG